VRLRKTKKMSLSACREHAWSRRYRWFFACENRQNSQLGHFPGLFHFRHPPQTPLLGRKTKRPCAQPPTNCAMQAHTLTVCAGLLSFGSMQKRWVPKVKQTPFSHGNVFLTFYVGLLNSRSKIIRPQIGQDEENGVYSIKIECLVKEV
jgi:hypothetical protein